MGRDTDTLSDKLSRSRDAADGLMRETRRAIGDVIDAGHGELWLRHDDAPDRETFADTDEGYHEYLAACRSWATERYSMSVENLRDESADLSTDGYPTPLDPTNRSAEREAIKRIGDAVEEVEFWAKICERIDDEVSEV